LVRILEHELSREPVEPRDPSLAVVAGETRVGGAFTAGEAVPARASHGGADEIALRESVPVARNLCQRLVSEDKPRLAVRGDAELDLGDLAVGPADTDLDYPQKHAVPGRLVDVLDSRRVRDAGLDDERPHAAVRPPSTVRIVPVAN